MRVDLPAAMRNPVSLIGVAVTTAMAVVFLLLLTLEFTGQLTNPYAGLLVFVAVPFVFVIGLVLIPIGIWRQLRRVAAGYALDDWPVVDLRLPRTRSVIVGVALLTIVNLFIVSLAGFGAVAPLTVVFFFASQFVAICDDPVTDQNPWHRHGIDRALKRRACGHWPTRLIKAMRP